MNTIALLAPYFERYITLERAHPYATYNYKARNMFGLPVIEATLHRPKCTPGSWLYVAAPLGASLESLQAGERLYVGSQTGDRMFRGDGLGGKNFHHAQMRSGNGDDNPINFLRSGQKIDVHRISAEQIGRAITVMTELASLHSLLKQPSKHVGYWIEQLTLLTQRGLWRWNTAPAEGPAIALFRTLECELQIALR
jgi:hypothetical protein